MSTFALTPAEHLGLGRTERYDRLLRAAGAPEPAITGGASDYDRFLALAAALPLCAGHPLAAEVQAHLECACGLGRPLCPHTANLWWAAWVERYGYGVPMTLLPLPAVEGPCPHCPPTSPRHCTDVELYPLPAGAVLGRFDSSLLTLEQWTACLVNILTPAGDRVPTLMLPVDYMFVRPNPYHVGQDLQAAVSGDLPVTSRNRLLTQALRIWGEALHARAATLYLRGGSPDAVLALLHYLYGTNRLPPLVWFPDDPADAGAISGLWPTVGTGLVLPVEDPAFALAAYASVAPIGRATIIEA